MTQTSDAPAANEPDGLRDYKALCDIWEECNAVDTVLGNKERLQAKIARLRDEVGARKPAAPAAHTADALDARAIAKRLREGQWNLRALQEMADMIADWFDPPAIAASPKDQP